MTILFRVEAHRRRASDVQRSAMLRVSNFVAVFVITCTGCTRTSIISPEAATPMQVADAEKVRETAIQTSRVPETTTQVVSPSEAAAPMSDREGFSPGANAHPAPHVPDVGQAAAKLLEAGLSFLETIAPPAPGVRKSTDHSKIIERAFSTLLRIDAQTQHTVLTVPLPESLTAERVAGAISGLLAKLARLS